ncbi:MAG: hypothetical protein ACM3SQ_12045 [Betaproteobacteria bacterium]
MSGAEITSGEIVAFYLFDIAETVNLQAVPGLIGGPAVAARLAPKPATPAYVQYDKPPLSFEGDRVGIAELAGFRVRVRMYDYGVMSLALTRPFAGSWADLVSAGQTLIENPELEQQAEQACRSVMARLAPALTEPRTDLLSEDYLVFAVYELSLPLRADALLEERGESIALMLRGERQPLSSQEQNKILGQSLSYLADDLVVPTWNAAFVYDTAAGAQAALEIMEFANSQLLEFRYYDRLLDDRLAAIYARLQRPRWHETWTGGRYAAARQVHSLFIDVNELTDRTENALKFIGDIYAARLFTLIGDRLGLERWKANIQDKLETLDDIYRFAVEQSSMSRGQFLELTIVLILILELALVFMGVMK